MSLTLIDKQDNFEIIRDQIAALIVFETINQKGLADAANKQVSDWDLNVYTERSNPWEQWLNDQADETPIVNVWFESENFDRKSSNSIERQKADGIFNIDCYGYGNSEDVPLGGHLAGDQMAAQNVQRTVKLIRNILMSAENTYLQLRGLVWSRWPQSITIFQPQSEGLIQQIVGARLTLQVEYNEFSPQVQAQTLDYVAIDILRKEDGQIMLEADYQYPIT